jgi:hypothetical protein
MNLQLDLFAPNPRSPSPELVHRDGLALRYWRHWLADADAVKEQLLALVPWSQETITLMVQPLLLQRLSLSSCGGFGAVSLSIEETAQVHPSLMGRREQLTWLLRAEASPEGMEQIQ